MKSRLELFVKTGGGGGIKEGVCWGEVVGGVILWEIGMVEVMRILISERIGERGWGGMMGMGEVGGEGWGVGTRKEGEWLIDW